MYCWCWVPIGTRPQCWKDNAVELQALSAVSNVPSWGWQGGQGGGGGAKAALQLNPMPFPMSQSPTQASLTLCPLNSRCRSKENNWGHQGFKLGKETNGPLAQEGSGSSPGPTAHSDGHFGAAVLLGAAGTSGWAIKHTNSQHTNWCLSQWVYNSRPSNTHPGPQSRCCVEDHEVYNAINGLQWSERRKEQIHWNLLIVTYIDQIQLNTWFRNLNPTFQWQIP